MSGGLSAVGCDLDAMVCERAASLWHSQAWSTMKILS